MIAWLESGENIYVYTSVQDYFSQIQMHKYTNTNTQVQKISAGEDICVHVSGEGLKYWPHIVFQSIKKMGNVPYFHQKVSNVQN